MGPVHWIEFIELNIGNEPAGRIDFQSKGYLNPRAGFTVVKGDSTGGMDFATADKQDKTIQDGGVQLSADEALTFLKSSDFAGLALKVEAVRLK